MVFVHVVGIAVISSDQHQSAHLVYGFFKPAQTKVNALHTNLGCLENTGMSDHVAIGIVAANKIVFAGKYGLYQKVADLRAFHPRTLFEWHLVGAYLDVVLEFGIDFAGLVAVIKVSNMPVLLRF